MRKTTVEIALNPKAFGREGKIEGTGYAAEIDGYPVVVHRPIRNVDGRAEFGDGSWGVSDPTTGLLIHGGWRGESRQAVLDAATRKVERLGGAQAIRDAVAKAEQS